MANKVPLTINTTSSTIEELPSGDNLDLTGSNISNVGNINAGNSISANFFVGTLYGNANTATTAGTVTTNSQPNITSVGTLTGLSSTGTVNLTGASNVSLGNISNVKITGGTSNQIIQTDGSGNLSFGTVSAASYMVQPVRVATLSNISLSGVQTIDGVVVSVGERVLVWRQGVATENGIYLVANGAWTRTTDFTTGAVTLAGGITVTVNAGTQLAGVTFVCTNTSAITIGSSAINFERSMNTGLISIWTSNDSFQTKANASANSGALAMGVGAIAAVDSTAIGYNAAVNNGQGVSVGYLATAGSTNGVAIGVGASSPASGAVAVGRSAGTALNTSGIALGLTAAGGSGSGANVIAIGTNAGFNSQGANSIAIGTNAGRTSQAANSIVINATGANLDNTTANSIMIKPVRAVTDITGLKQVYYNPSTGELVYYNI